MAYVYDVLNRVTQIEENGATSGPGLLASYAYDSLGRRASITRAGGTGAGTAYGYDGAGRLYTLAQSLAGSASVGYTLGYNAAGQVVGKQVSNSAYVARPGSITAGYTANGLNQYTGVTGVTAGYAPANSAALSYDPTGALQTETTAGATTTLLYDGADLVGEYASSGAILDRYVPGPGTDEPVVWYQGAGTTTRNWLTADDQGSVIGYADQNANALATYLYGPYGEPITAAGAPAWGGSRYRYTGQIEIPEAQLYHYKARAYDPAMGLFYQTDPMGTAGGINLYAYATDDPINGSDPTGLGSPGIISTDIGNGCAYNQDYTILSDGNDGEVGGGFSVVNSVTCLPGGGTAPGYRSGGEGGGGKGGVGKAPQNKQSTQPCVASSGPFNPNAKPTNLPPGYSPVDIGEGRTNVYMQNAQGQLSLTPDYYAQALTNYNNLQAANGHVGFYGGTIAPTGAGIGFSLAISGTRVGGAIGTLLLAAPALVTSAIGEFSTPPPPPSGCSVGH